MEHRMIVAFRRTGEKRYGVEALREGLPVVYMHPAPGYDRQIPHDMMHMVVESQLGLTRGIFGQLAAGGNAGSFQLSVQRDQSSREARRKRKRVTKRGKKLLKVGHDDCIQSERATYIFWLAWRARTSSRPVDKQAGDTAPITELGLQQSKLDEIFKHLDELSSHWSSLDVGQSVAVSWPDLAVVESGR
jgi:hypothetical protein